MPARSLLVSVCEKLPSEFVSLDCERRKRPIKTMLGALTIAFHRDFAENIVHS